MFEVLVVGLGGCIGSVARYLTNKAAETLELSFPLSTLVVNGVASLALGLLLGFIASGGAVPERLRLFLSVGVLGGLSTFSAFSGETLELLQKHDYLLAGVNIVLNVGICLGATALGFITIVTMLTASGTK